jgi:hypothetical protein
MLCSQSNDNVAALESNSPQRGSPGSASFSSSRRTSDDKSQSLKQKLTSKVTSECRLSIDLPTRTTRNRQQPVTLARWHDEVMLPDLACGEQQSSS